MRAVILAAGDGGRLGHRTTGIPKPLVTTGGRPLIAFTLEALAVPEVEEVVIVTGYLEERLVAALSEGWQSQPLRFVSNPRFRGGASLSLAAARGATGNEPFLLLMADHLFSARIVRALLDAWRAGGPSLVATDGSAWPEAYREEATHIQLEPGTDRVAAIGKGLDPWHVIDTGAFLLTPEVWGALDASPDDCELSVVFGELARRRRLRAVDISGASWYDVDTEDDLLAAGRMLAEGGR